MINAFRYIGSGLGNFASYLGQKCTEYDVGNKLVKGGAATLEGVKITGNFLYKNSKPIFKYMSIKAVQGIGYLCQQVQDQLSSHVEVKTKNDNKEDEKIIDKNNNKKEKLGMSVYNDNYINEGNNKNMGDYVFVPSVDFPTFEEINVSKNSIKGSDLAPAPGTVNNINENKLDIVTSPGQEANLDYSYNDLKKSDSSIIEEK